MKQLLIIIALASLGTVACSPDQPEQQDQPAAQDKAAEQTPPPAAVIAAIRERLSKQLDGINPEDLTPSPIPGLYQVSKGMAIGYVSQDGRYLIEGDLLDLETETNLTEQMRNDNRKTTLAAIPEDKMIIFEPKKASHTVTVFTDVDCGYCRKMHSQIDGYLKEGIRVRYVFYPLRGENAASYKKAENVWCSKDRQEALTQAKQGKDVKAEQCETPVAMHLTTGMQLGIRGTPGVITESGEMLPGYMPPKALKGRLEPVAEPVQKQQG
ncbi:MAG: DsbC family protein [Nevskiales bacterium]